jgi:hypothetical protein
MAKVKFTVLLPEELVERTRNTVASLQGRPLFLSLSQMAEAALLAENERLEREHNEGQPFPALGRVKTGRPLGSKRGG